MRNILVLLILTSQCILTSCGTTGRITFYEYSVSKDTIENAITTFLIKNPEYAFPKNDSAWKKYTPKDSAIYYDQIENHLVDKYRDLRKFQVYVYFKKKPEEVYRLKYYMNEEYWVNHPNYSRIALVSVVKKGGKWRYSDPIFNTFFIGRRRVEKKLEQEILNKLPYKYVKIK